MEALLALLMLGGFAWWIAASRGSKTKESRHDRLVDDDEVHSSAFQEAPSLSASESLARGRGSKRLRIFYTDVDGIETERVVSVIDARPVHGDVMFDARCSLRSDERTFRASRVSHAESASDGESITELDRYLAGLFRFELYEKTPRADPEWWSPAMSSAYLLVWLAAADGRIDGSQKQVVIDFAAGLDRRFANAHWEPLNYRGRRMGPQERSEMARKVKLGGARLVEATLQAALKVHAARKLGCGASERDALGELRKLLS